MQKKKILMIDDNEKLCDLVKKGLEMTGDYEVTVAHDGKSGLGKIKWVKPDLIICDIVMPKKDGLDVLKDIKENSKTQEIPVIMLSGNEDETSQLAAAELYNDMYITKPVEFNELKSKIEEVFRRRGLS